MSCPIKINKKTGKKYRLVFEECDAHKCYNCKTTKCENGVCNLNYFNTWDTIIMVNGIEINASYCRTCYFKLGLNSQQDTQDAKKPHKCIY
jgi:hypothetical protein